MTPNHQTQFGDGLPAKNAEDAKTYSWEKSDAHPIGELAHLQSPL